MFCPHCGSETELVIAAATAADTVDREVEIERIRAERDIEVARINARQERDYNETRVEVAAIEAEAEVGAAEATAEVVAAAIAGPPEPETEADPIIIDAPQLPAGDDLDGQGDDEPPPADDDHSPKTPGKPRGLGMW